MTAAILGNVTPLWATFVERITFGWVPSRALARASADWTPYREQTGRGFVILLKQKPISSSVLFMSSRPAKNTVPPK